MTETNFYKTLLNLDNSWEVSLVKIDHETRIVCVHLEYTLKQGLCPFSQKEFPIYDYAPQRQWRHLDTMQYQTFLLARIPRIIDNNNKVTTIAVPWADFSERYTHLLSMAVIQLLQATKNQTKTAQFFKLSFDIIHRIMHNALERGLANRDKTTPIESIGIDEKSFQKGHQYCTILTDATNKRVLEVEPHRTKEAAKNIIDKSLSKMQQEKLKIITGDMWEAYQNTAKEMLPQASYVLDRFHLIKYLNKAIDETRRSEVKDNPILKNARFVLLKKQHHLTQKQHGLFKIIMQENYLVSQVWQAKENFKALFGQPNIQSAYATFNLWIDSIKISTLKPLIVIRELFQKHSHAIVNSLCHSDSNAYAERMNGSIQELKNIAKGFRRVENFRKAILFHYGKLNFSLPLNNQ